jgi:HK97 family phage major capsid protein
MSGYEDRNELLTALRETRQKIEQGDEKTKAQISDCKTAIARIEKEQERLATSVNRERAFGMMGRIGNGEPETEAKAARGLLELKHIQLHPKHDLRAGPPMWTTEQLDEATHAVRGIKNLFRCTAVDQLPDLQRKALTSFNMGANSFMLPPEMSSQVLSCLVYPSDIAGMVNNITTSSSSVRFLVDNVILDQAAWACEANCFANNPQQHLNEGLGELEIKPETLRYIVCATRDLLEDSAISLESWILEKAQRAFSIQISNAIFAGDGIGKPLGLLRGGYPICDTGAATPAGQFTWQDLVMLKWETPLQFHTGGQFWMNQRTWALSLTMSDAIGRPLMIQDPTAPERYSINGSPVQIITQLPDVAPGSLPVLFINPKQAYMVVNRKSVTMQVDPYSAGWCQLYKFESRVGGAPTCVNSARWLRIH